MPYPSVGQAMIRMAARHYQSRIERPEREEKSPWHRQQWMRELTADVDEINRCQKELTRLRQKKGIGILHTAPETGDWVLYAGRDLPDALAREREGLAERPDIRQDLARNGGTREVIRG
jgi:hypothetical protein